MISGTQEIHQTIPFIPIGGLLLFMVGSVIAIKVSLAKRPTWKEANEKFKDIKVCSSDHRLVNNQIKEIDKKVNCLPEMKETLTIIKTKLDILLPDKKQ